MTHADPQRVHFDNPAYRYRSALALSPPLSQRKELQLLQSVLRLRPGDSILDFGSGNGRVSLWFLRQGYSVTAVDISTRSLHELKRIYAANKKPKWGKLTIQTTIPNKKFDTVVGADILHHVDIPTYLPKLRMSLKPGGRLAISEPNGWHLAWYLFLVLQKLPWRIEKGILSCTYTNLMHQAVTAGFSHVSVHGFGAVAPQLFTPIPFLFDVTLRLGSVQAIRPFAFRLVLEGQRGIKSA